MKMTDEELTKAWEAAKDVRQFFKENEGAKWSDLEFVSREWAAYGDWNLYRGTDGNYYVDYMSIGD